MKVGSMPFLRNPNRRYAQSPRFLPKEALRSMLTAISEGAPTTV